MIALALLGLGVALLIAARLRYQQGRRPPRRPISPTAPVRPRSTRSPGRDDVPHALYRYPHATRPGSIYYGISNDPDARHARHARDPRARWWFSRSTGVMVIVAWFPNRTEAMAAESRAIRTAALAGEDIANDHHNPNRRIRRAAR